LVLSAYLSSPDTDNGDAPLSAHWMRAVNLAQIAELARIRTHREEDHPTLGSAVKVGVKDEEAFEVLQLLVGVLNETGRILQEMGTNSLGVWLRETLERAKGHGFQVVRELASTFPAFRDIHEIDGEPVYLLKKAFWLVTNVALRYQDEQMSFTTPSTEGFPIFADNVVPSEFIFSRFVSTRAHELSKSTDSDKAWLSEWTEPELDAWIWNEAKGPGLRDVERIAEKGTVYY
ncbi:hypothetical protein RHOSPDRAFT_16408, partial [Rhodotorula sp. JG-1b]